MALEQGVDWGCGGDDAEEPPVTMEAAPAEAAAAAPPPPLQRAKLAKMPKIGIDITCSSPWSRGMPWWA